MTTGVNGTRTPLRRPLDTKDLRLSNGSTIMGAAGTIRYVLQPVCKTILKLRNGYMKKDVHVIFGSVDIVMVYNVSFKSREKILK